MKERNLGAVTTGAQVGPRQLFVWAMVFSIADCLTDWVVSGPAAGPARENPGSPFSRAVQYLHTRIEDDFGETKQKFRRFSRKDDKCER